jgi:NitT/TauT family transport system ATP-binding protein
MLMQDLVRFEQVTFGYDSTRPPVLRDVSLSIRRGEVLTLLGASGCGKSTLLRMVAGLLFPTSGECSFEGEPVQRINTRVGYMTQGDTLLPWRTVRANVAVPLRIRRVPRSEVEKKVDRLLDLVHLSDAGTKYPRQLSGGMVRRALLARSVITEPKMVLMDEPFAAIDADLRESLHDEVRKTVEALEQTVLFVTHDIAEAVLLSDRVVVVGGRPSATVVDILDIPFGRGRDMDAVRMDTRFFELQKQLRSMLQTKEVDHE